MSTLEESKGVIALALETLKATLIEEQMSMAVCKQHLIFFKTKDIVNANYDVSKVEKIAVNIDNLVK